MVWDRSGLQNACALLEEAATSAVILHARRNPAPMILHGMDALLPGRTARTRSAIPWD